jgi:hypothetical protein
MDWYDISGKPHERTLAHDGRLSSLASEWERELAAMWRLETDVNNGAYLQFLCNWGRDTYVHASQALKKIGAVRMARIIDQCQALVDEHWGDKPLDYRKLLKSLPKKVSQRILDLSYAFMDYPDDIPQLGMRYYGPRFTADGAAVAAGYSLDEDDELPPWGRVVRSAEELARAAEADARITDRKCPQCGKPCPSYRKTCKHCGQKVSAP